MFPRALERLPFLAVLISYINKCALVVLDTSTSRYTLSFVVRDSYDSVVIYFSDVLDSLACGCVLLMPSCTVISSINTPMK